MIPTATIPPIVPPTIPPGQPRCLHARTIAVPSSDPHSVNPSSQRSWSVHADPRSNVRKAPAKVIRQKSSRSEKGRRGNYGDEWNGKEGYTKLQPREGRGQWSRHESNAETEFFPQSGTALEFSADGMRIVDLGSSRQVVSFSQEWVEQIMEGLAFDATNWLKPSPDGRFIVAGSKIYDRESQTIRDWQVQDGFPQPHFHGFTPRGFALCTDASNFIAWHPYSFLTDVPLGSRLLAWLMRERVRLIDPATGLQVACTQPLSSSPDSVTLSYDGSRMAVFNNEGVFVYDVLEKFR